jgi:hypothetical protein
VCERLALDYPNVRGEMSLAPVRCWDTRARVLGLPDECPVIWMPGDLPGRNPECLALARRDPTICSFAPSPGRCRALISGDSASCEASDGAPDCHLALAYWKGLIPVGTVPLLYDPDKRAKSPLEVKVELHWRDQARPRIHVEGPTSAAAISWPAGRARVAFTEDTSRFWGGTVPLEAAQVSWRAGTPAIKLAFAPAGALSGTRRLQPPGPTAPATLIVLWPETHDYWRCAPGPASTGEVRFDAGGGQPGDFVTGTVEARNLPCSDGTELNVDMKLRLLILDVR